MGNPNGRPIHGYLRGGKYPKLYYVWNEMKQRCYNTKHPHYTSYGGRGIEVCDRWLHSYVNFINDMGMRLDGYSLERIDNNEGYRPGNCKWATKTEQMNNTRHNIFLTYNGVRASIKWWANKLNINYHTLKTRHQVEWSDKKSLTYSKVHGGTFT